MRQVLVALAITLGWSVPASAEAVLYIHPHPVDPAVGKGMCHIEGPHVHAYAPHAAVLYTRVNQHYAFVGDPVEFDDKHEKYPYYGHHPLFWLENGDGAFGAQEYCFITGPHYHWYQPPAEIKFTLKGGAYWYLGDHPSWYASRWPRRHRRMTRYYARVTVPHPTVTIEPPSGFIGLYIGPTGPRPYGVVAAGVGFRGPGVSVGGGVGLNIRLPGVGVLFGGGGGRVRRHRDHGYGPGWGHRGGYRKKHHYKRGHRGHGPPDHAPAWGHRRKHGDDHGRGHGHNKKRRRR